MRHIYAKRVFYVDEDSWGILVADQYDNRGRLWRVSEGHGINYYDIQSYWTTLEVHTDLISGRYLAHGLDNENVMYDFSHNASPGNFTPAALRRLGRR
jgi:ligand-binding sensor domain-containing protein